MREDIKTQLDAIARREKRKFVFVPVIIIVGSIFMAMGLHALGFRAESALGPNFVQVEDGMPKRASATSHFN